jgi:hypothetical protein
VDLAHDAAKLVDGRYDRRDKSFLLYTLVDL